MSKKPYIEFYPGDWRRDSGVSMLSLEEKGAWIETLIAMDDHEPQGELQGTIQNFARLWGVDNFKGMELLNSLIGSRVCNVKWVSSSDKDELDDYVRQMSEECLSDVPYFWITLISRRMKREEAEKERWREDKKKQRQASSKKCPPDVPKKSSECPPALSSSSSSSIKKEGERAVAPNVENLIKEARKIKGWNLMTWEQDAEFFNHLLAEHPEDLVEKVLEDLRTYQENPAKKYKNLQSTLRNWCSQEAHWRGDRGEEDGSNGEEARLDDDGKPMYLLDGEWIDRKEFDRLMAAGELVRTDKVWKRKTTEVAS